jgi:predicted O-linked N-acetylglucosamine transferase (SPINDLY family)
VAADGAVPSFHLAHHGRNSRPLLEKFAALYQASFPRRQLRPGTGKPRIGFVVTRHHEGGFLRSMSGIVEQLDPRRFAPVVLCSQGALAACRGGIHGEDVEWLALPDRFAGAVDRIAAARCDILYHWQIGTDPLNYFLPFAGLAPVQCTSWGSHGTTGIAAVDYCLSSEWIESPGAEQRYTERLVRLPALPTCERRQPPPEPAQRGDFGLPENGHVYCCPQRIAKLHPEADALFAAILQQDSRGFLAVLEGRNPSAAELLRRRFQRTLGALASRVIFVPHQSPTDFRRLLTLADVVVDAPHYSAGFTAYDAFALALPIVSLPDDFAVGRYTLACYRRMGLERWVPSSAEEYVALAVRLGTDRDYWQECRSEIARRSEVLFEDVQAVREYERFFEEALAQARARTV